MTADYRLQIVDPRLQAHARMLRVVHLHMAVHRDIFVSAATYLPNLEAMETFASSYFDFAAPEWIWTTFYDDTLYAFLTDVIIAEL